MPPLMARASFHVLINAADISLLMPLLHAATMMLTLPCHYYAFIFAMPLLPLCFEFDAFTRHACLLILLMPLLMITPFAAIDYAFC